LNFFPDEKKMCLSVTEPEQCVKHLIRRRCFFTLQTRFYCDVFRNVAGCSVVGPRRVARAMALTRRTCRFVGLLINIKPFPNTSIRRSFGHALNMQTRYGESITASLISVITQHYDACIWYRETAN